jgi:hypothetical protein
MITDRIGVLSNRTKWSVNYGPLGQTKFNEYLTQADWHDLKAAVEKRQDPSPAAQLLTNSHRLISSGELRLAVIEAVSALEVAISDAVSSPIKGADKLTDAAAPFLNETPLKARMIVATSLIGGIDNETVEDALAAIELRNRVVHDGFLPEERNMKQVRAALEVATKLIPGPRIKFPVLTGSNFIAEPDVWQKTGGYESIVAAGASISEA